MQIVRTVAEMQKIAAELNRSGKTIAYVPTMGYLHEGHASLIREATGYGDAIIVSIFVNPVQFAPNEDFEKYPRDLVRDCKIAEEAGAHIVFHPETKDMYPDGYNTLINVSGVSKKFEGAFRPNHFAGVATVVAKFFNIIRPQFALFGQKDYQQTLVVRQFTRDLNMDIKIVVAPTVREADGLAKSSRNTYLSPEDRAKAPGIFRSLEKAVEAIENGEKRRKIINAIILDSLRKAGNFRIDYCLSADAENLDEPEEFLPGQRIVMLVAAYLGKTRLIDNVTVSLPSPISMKPAAFVDGVNG